MTQEYRLETVAVHAGQPRDEGQLSRGVPVYRTASYLFRSTEHSADLFSLKAPGNIYTRLMNPTQAILEERMAAMEGGKAALALASGTSAIFYAIINVARAGDEIVAAKNLYGGTFTMFNDILPQLGIRVRMVTVNDFEGLAQTITEKTRAVFIEAIGNPVLEVSDIRAYARIAHENDVPLIVDATFATPYLLRPIEHGADIVVHSLTKWLGGHGGGIGGVVVDSGKFNWKNPKFDLFNEPDPSYHGLRYAHDLGELNPVAFAVRMRLVPLRNLGAAISPDNAWMFLQGIETLHLRMMCHCSNAMKTASFLARHEKVEWVRYPGLSEGNENNQIAATYLKDGYGGMVVFGIEGGRKAAARFINGLKLFSHVANVGDAKSLAIHPASTTHSQLDDQSLQACGIHPELIRLSIGIEHIDDILADISQALERIRPPL